MSSPDPLQLRIEELKREFLKTRTDRQRFDSLKQRLALLKEWLSLSQRRLEAIRDGREPALNPLLDPMPADAAEDGLQPAPGDSPVQAAEEASSLWVRLLTSVEVDGILFPAGVIVQVPASRADELLATEAAALVTPASFSAEVAGTAARTAADDVDSAAFPASPAETEASEAPVNEPA